VNLDLDETQSLLQQTVRSFLAKEVSFDRIRTLEREQRQDDALWRSVCEQGWSGLAIGESFGGGGGSLVDAGLLVLEFARRAAIVPIAEVLSCARVIEDHAPSGRATTLLPALISGEVVPVPALAEEEAGADEVSASVAGGRLCGEKVFVDYASGATHHLVSAMEDGSLGLYLVDNRGAGLAREALRSIGRTPVSVVRYEDAPAERVAGSEAVADLVRLCRILAAVQCLGAMQQALEMTIAYAQVREQFGKPIGSFQAVHHHGANMAIQVASTRILVFEALSALDHGAASDSQIALAKASASRAAPEVTMLAHQIHGGNGVIEENDLYFFTLRGKERSLAWGSAEECLAIVADSVDDPIEWL
jgi:alkylation response protein AidB-like acyl-CoA dehydrogenase